MAGQAGRLLFNRAIQLPQRKMLNCMMRIHAKVVDVGFVRA